MTLAILPLSWNPTLSSLVGGLSVTITAQWTCALLAGGWKGAMNQMQVRWTAQLASCGEATVSLKHAIPDDLQSTIMRVPGQTYFRTPFPIPTMPLGWRMFMSLPQASPMSKDAHGSSSPASSSTDTSPAITPSISSTGSAQVSRSISPAPGQTSGSPGPSSHNLVEDVGTLLGPARLTPQCPRIYAG